MANPPRPFDMEDENVYVVEAVLDKKKRYGTVHYLLKWEGNHPNTWVPEADVNEQVVVAFEMQQEKQRKAKLEKKQKKTEAREEKARKKAEKVQERKELKRERETKEAVIESPPGPGPMIKIVLVLLAIFISILITYFI